MIIICDIESSKVPIQIIFLIKVKARILTKKKNEVRLLNLKCCSLKSCVYDTNAQLVQVARHLFSLNKVSNSNFVDKIIIIIIITHGEYRPHSGQPIYSQINWSPMNSVY